MSSKNKDATQRLLAIMVIIAMMLTMGIPLPVILFFAIVIYFVWRAVQHTERQEVGRVFDFYIAASEILRDDERRWYGFEIAKVIKEGENLLHEMRDAPPLVYFALGALAHRVGDYKRATQHLAFVVEDKKGDETSLLDVSPELHRYVEVLRQLEREPAQGPQTMAAIRNLERTRAARAEDLLTESRERAANTVSLPAPEKTPRLVENRDTDSPHSLNAQTYESASLFAAYDETDEHQPPLHEAVSIHLTNDAADKESVPPTQTSSNSETHESRLTAKPTRPPISEVLRDVYDEEKKTA